MYKMQLPSSKSITNRDLILASLASWKSILKGFSLSEDIIVMIEALRKLWIKIKRKDWVLNVYWWIDKICWNWSTLFLGNSWTWTRFLVSLSVLNKFWEITITWEKRMMERPMKDLIFWIKQLWVDIKSNNLYLPIKIKWWNVSNFHIKMNWTVSSQFFTAMLQIAPVLKKWLEIEVIEDIVSKPYIDMTIIEMKKFWVDVLNDNYKFFKIPPQKYLPQNLTIEWDASALSYIVCYIALHSWEVKITNIWNTTKQGDYRFLQVMKMFWLEYFSDSNTTTILAPWIKNVSLEKYKNYKISFEGMPDVSMSFMIMSIFLHWNTKIIWLQTLNFKESNRIIAMKNELVKIWVEIENDDKSITIWEYKWHKWLVDIETYNDHRIAMCFWILATFIGNLNILDANCVNKTYPNFWNDLKKLKAKSLIF
jgi:3-phosphoshikimate 1-carboxyvinyltransferase